MNPPAWPDLNPMNFSALSSLEAKICSVAHPSADVLKTSLQSEWAETTQETQLNILGYFTKKLFILQRGFVNRYT